MLFIVGQYSTWTQDSLVDSIVGLEFQSRQGSGTLISSKVISFCRLQNLLPPIIINTGWNIRYL